MMTQRALLIDTTLCIGCNACQDACKTQNHLPEGEEKKLTATAYTALEEHDGIYVRRMCQHCVQPTCASVRLQAVRSMGATALPANQSDMPSSSAVASRASKAKKLAG